MASFQLNIREPAPVINDDRERMKHANKEKDHTTVRSLNELPINKSFVSLHNIIVRALQQRNRRIRKTINKGITTSGKRCSLRIPFICLLRCCEA